MARKRSILTVVLAVLVTLVACSDDSGREAQPSTASTPATTGAAAPPTAGPSTSAPAANPAATTPTVMVASGRRVTWENVTFTLPRDWDDVRGTGLFAAGPRIYDYKGYAIGRLDAVSGFDASIDDLIPKACLRQVSGAPFERPSAVVLLESGFAPVGDRTAHFRRWSATCAAGTEEHRAWVLPVSRLAFYEVCHDASTVAVASTAAVVPAATAAPVNRPPWPNEIPGSCRNDLTDSATGT